MTNSRTFKGRHFPKPVILLCIPSGAVDAVGQTVDFLLSARRGQVEQVKRRYGKVLASFVEDLFAAFA
jgi:hypothetical protein